MDITNYIVGACIGLVLALIVVLILQNTVFKGKNMTIVYCILFIAFAVCGGIVQKNYFTVSAEAMPTPQEQIDTITDAIEDTWENTNGGFTFEQIQTTQDDNECPSFEDQIIGLKCYDFGSYIVFGSEDNGTYQNAVFYKSSNGLILDGIMNMHVSMTGIKWFYAYNLDSFTWVDNRNSEPNYTITYVPISWDVINGKYDNLLSLSRQTTEFLQYNYKFRTNKDEMTNYVMTNIANLSGKNASAHFIKFGDVELIGTGATGYVKINSFYNYLYEQIKGESYNTTKLIDCSNSLCLPIPEAQQSNYPISVDKKADYDDADYYGVYRCGIAVNLNFVQGNTTINETTKNEEYIDTLKNDDDYKGKVEVEDYTPNYTYSKLKVNFLDTNSSDLSNVNLLTQPVKITFSCNDTTLTKTVLIDSIEKLNAGITVLLSSDTTWNYFIDSEALIFENYRGSFTIKSESTSVSFSYYFLNNYTIASVGLNAIGSIDMSTIDLANNPVKIILANDDHSYQFVFDDNSQIDTQKSMLVEMGTYNYTILSKQLEFASVTGTLTITTTDRIMLFNYAVTTYSSALSFDVTVSQYSTTNNQFRLYSEASNVSLIRDTLSSAKVYIVTCVIYDSDGRLMETFTHTHSVTGTCSDTWYASNLVDGETYTLQLRFTDRDDSTITYLSDIADFTFNNNIGYRVEYTATQNQ